MVAQVNFLPYGQLTAGEQGHLRKSMSWRGKSDARFLWIYAANTQAGGDGTRVTPMAVTISSPDGHDRLAELHRRVIAATELAPAHSWNAAELGAVVFVLECIVEGRESALGGNGQLIQLFGR